MDFLSTTNAQAIPPQRTMKHTPSTPSTAVSPLTLTLLLFHSTTSK